MVTSYNETSKTYYYEVNRSQISSNDNVVLKTQSDVDALANSGVSIVNGDLIIGDNISDTEDVIKDLSALSNLTTVKQNIFIYSSFAGTSLKGLENIKTASGLYIGSSSTTINTPNMIDVELPSLKSLGSLVINSNTVKSIDLQSVEDIGYLSISAPHIESIDFASFANCHTDFIMNLSSSSDKIAEMNFPSLKSVGGIMTLNNYEVESMEFPKLELIGSALTIKYMSIWKNLSFPALKQINGELFIQYMSSIESLSMPALQTINGRLYCDFNYGRPSFKSLNFESLKEVLGQFSFYLSPNNEAESLSLPSLERVNSTITFQQTNNDNTNIKSIDLSSLKTVSNLTFYGLLGVEALDLSKCESISQLSLITMSELKNLKTPSVIGTFTINAGSREKAPINIDGLEEVTNTFDLTNMKGTESYTVASIKKIGTFRFTDSNLKSLSMPDLEEMKSLTIQTYGLASLNMDKLKTITADCTFTSIRDLTDDGLSFASLKEIGGKLSISGYSTPVLTTLKGFAVLETAGSVSISNMKNLVDFSALRSVADRLTTGWTTSGNGYNPTLSDMQNGKYIKE